MVDGDCGKDRTALYRHFDADGTLLYVGVSLSAITRLCSHRSQSSWFQQIATMTTEWHPTRELALSAEKAAIQDERPLFNVVHNKAVVVLAVTPTAEISPDLGPMPWGPRGKPFYLGQEPCPPELQAILFRECLA